MHTCRFRGFENESITVNNVGSNVDNKYSRRRQCWWWFFVLLGNRLLFSGCKRNTKSSSQMRPVLETADLRCYSTDFHRHSNRYRMPARESVSKGSGFESKGIILLVICGFYAVVLFLVARILSYLVSRATSTGEFDRIRIFLTKDYSQFWQYNNRKKDVIICWKR